MKVFILTKAGNVDVGNMDVYTDKDSAVQNALTLNHLPSRTYQMVVWEAEMELHLEKVIY